MFSFPALTPSRRSFTPGEYPHTEFRSLNGLEGRVRHSNVMIGSSLRLTYIGLTEQDMLDILLHYQDTQGIYLSFALPPNTLSGLTAADYTLTGFSWRYATPPTVLDLPCNRYTVEVELESVESKAALISVGLRSRIGLTLQPGVAAAANGIDADISLTFTPGTGEIGGFDFTIGTSYADNSAAGEAFASGFNGLITTSFLGASGAGGASVNGISSGINLSIDPGDVEIIISVNGLTEVVTLSILGGDADANDVSPEIEGFAIAPIVFDTAEWEYSELGFAPLETLEPSPSLQLELAAVELL
jgi:hypothetical protein